MDSFVPLWAPYYSAPPVTAIARFWRKYARFDGRASRSEFWWAVLANALVWVVIVVVLQAGAAVGAEVIPPGRPNAGILPGTIIASAWLLVTLVPGLALLARRFHDLNLNGWLLLILLVPTLGPIVVAILALLPSSAAGARFDRPDAELPGYVPEVPGAELPGRDYGWPPIPLPYASTLGGQPLFGGPRQPEPPGREGQADEPDAGRDEPGEEGRGTSGPTGSPG